MDAKEALSIVAAGKSLGRAEAESAMASMISGEATPAQLGALLAALAVRGETVDEIAGFAAGLRTAAVPVRIPDGAIDTCGTGGDRSSSFNISTVAAIVAASAGARVAKHGNRAASSACGSADVLEALGVKIDLGPESVAACVEQVGVGFMFAPRFHPAMRHAGPVRREIGIRTIFNVLGPLANPAGVRRQLLGVPSAALGERMVAVLRELGAERALVVHSEDGLDEISPSGPTRTWDLRDGRIREGELSPEDADLVRAPRDSVRGGDSEVNARIARDVLSGRARDGVRTAVLLNAGAACYIAGLAPDVRGGVAVATQAVDSGAAAATLERWIATSGTLS
jgi:anthranilate phosphoribosyltransferase